MVASSFLGFANRLVIICALAGLICDASVKSFCDSENSDTSAAETSAESNSKTIIPTMPKSRLVSKVVSIVLESGSKFKILVKQSKTACRL